MPERTPHGSRVRGASQIRERANWKFRIGQREWIERLNFVRSKLGDETVSQKLGYSLTDRTFKSVRRLTSGERTPNAERYEIINNLYNKLQRTQRLIPVAEEIWNSIVGGTLPNYATKIRTFLLKLKQFRYRTVKPENWIDPSSIDAARKMIGAAGGGRYIRTCDTSAFNRAPSKEALALILIAKHDSRNGEDAEPSTEVYLQSRLQPSLTLMQNAIDTWIENLRDQNYIGFSVIGVWWSYV